ncbi:MAG TPA: hypothetical protein VN961_03550 [Streptosporangiaceae bacterium]|nr:hypothetical protein [Streptosporangiaceae bacterium]
MGAAEIEVFRVNVKGPWLALTAAGPLLRRGSAVVLNASNNANLGMLSAQACSGLLQRPYG